MCRSHHSAEYSLINRIHHPNVFAGTLEIDMVKNRGTALGIALFAATALSIPLCSLAQEPSAETEVLCVKDHGRAYKDLAMACYSDAGCKLVEAIGGEPIRDYDRDSVPFALGREKIEGIVTSSQAIIKKIAEFGYPCKKTDVAQASASAEPGKCLEASEPVAGDLRKVVSRKANGELITNWHIVAAEPICITIGESTMRHVTDLQVVFSDKVNTAELDQWLGRPIGVKGNFAWPSDDSFTGDVVVMDAVLYDDLDDAGLIRRKK